MKITVIKAENGWNVFPQSGHFQGKLIGKADGVVLTGVTFGADSASGEISGIWGLEVLDPMIYNDPRTIRGLRIGNSFRMLSANPVNHDGRCFALAESGDRLQRAESLWALGDEMQTYGETLSRPH